MKSFVDIIRNEIEEKFVQNSYSKEYAKVEISKRADICDYQINSAFSIAKELHKKPFDIANDIVGLCEDIKIKFSNEDAKLIFVRAFDKVEALEPGFVNLTISEEFLQYYLYSLLKSNIYLGLENDKNKQKIIVDFGGANVAKPLHIGHLRSAVIGECIKRLLRRKGNEVIGDIHLGDYGLQMGLTICGLMERGIENTFTIRELEEVYPASSAKAKEKDENGNLKYQDFYNRSHEVTKLLQEEKEPYYSIWKRIVDISIKDLKKNYDSLNVYFELWNGEASVSKYIPELINDLCDRKIAYESDGALVVDVKEESDKKEIPPCIIQKKDGAVLYATTDLATIIDREIKIKPNKYIYITDIRQALHFEQVFRVAKKASLIDSNQEMVHIGFGTMNGKDGTPFKTREGGILRLEILLNEVKERVLEKMIEKDEQIASQIALSALKFGDLSNIISKDYIFDIDKFISFEGHTGPYILYTIVRIKSILKRLETNKLNNNYVYYETSDKVTKNLELQLVRYIQEVDLAYNELAPHKLCNYIYDISNSFNSFYHEHNILKEENIDKKSYYVSLIKLTLNILNDIIEILGFSSPERM
ncbi:MAG: arginine--tRNA ligase [Eubacteriales bacterium]|nr:arginine--tRNA ligase [Eubacteriales bacterium]